MTKNFETILLNSCSSTMDEAKKYAQETKRDHIFCVIARNQTEGRGRGGSTWIQSQPKIIDKITVEKFSSLSDALKNENDFLPLTIVIPSQKLKIPIEWLSIAVGCALYDTFEITESFLNNNFPNLSLKENKNKFFIKWPNDIILMPSGKKISGILCESSLTSGNINEVFIGIGLNFFSHPGLENSTSFFDALFNEKKNKLRENIEFIQTLLKYFSDVFCKEIEEYLLHRRTLKQLKDLAFQRFIPKGTMLSVNKGAIKGKFLTLGDNGALFLEGINDPIFSGDINLVPSNLAMDSGCLSKIPPKKSAKFKGLAAMHSRSTQEAGNKLSKPTIALDFGNTRIHLASKNSHASIMSAHLNYEDDFSKSSSIKSALKLILENLIIDKTACISIFYTSVINNDKANEFLEKITSFIKKFFPEIKFNITNLTENEIFAIAKIQGEFSIQRVGADRALKFYFASLEAKKIQKNTLIFSFGTAVTCEGVSKSGFILENFVSPGIQMSLNALHDYTALLPSLTADAKLFSPEGKIWDQEVYLQRGVFISAVSAVLTTAKLHEPCYCYFSGGNAKQIIEIIQDFIKKTGIFIEFKLVENLETEIILQLAELLSRDSITEPKQILPDKNLHIHEKQNLPQEVLKSMLKSRVLEKKDRKIAIREEEFRKIGGRIENSEGDRFDLYMAHKFKFHTREEWRERILSSEVMVEHNSSREIDHTRKPLLTKVKPTYRIKDFDQIWLFHPPEYEPDFINTIKSIYDNKDICIFAKPPNLVVHAAGLYLKNTFIEHIAKMGYENCSPVHRIDRETSGILVCARKSETRKILSDAFRYSQVKKMYLAVTKGTNELPEEFAVNSPIGVPEHSIIRLKLWVNGNNPQPALTYFKKLARVDDYTLFACLPVTGRTNQIRIHLASIGHWIVGDKMYYENENVFIEFYEKGFTQWVHSQVIFPRHMLHNTSIMLEPELNVDPLSFEPIVCSLPDDMIGFDIVKKLMQAAKLPVETEEQTKCLKNIFLELHSFDFSKAPIIN